MRSRIALGLAVLVLLALAWWSWRQLVLPAGSTPPATATVTQTPVPTPTPLQAPAGYRLAGIALGEPDSFVVVEAPGGSNVLYRLDEEIPGLGRLVRIEAERVVISTPKGEFDLWLAPAATPTPTRTVILRALTPSRSRTPSPGRSAPGSAFSDALDRPAS